MKKAFDGRYQLLEVVEIGAVGTTHAARHVLLGSPAVLTFVAPEAVTVPDRRAMLEDGVRAASRLRHDHIAPVVDLAQDGARLYVVESPVEGDPLDRVLRETGALLPHEALDVARQIADAMALAHARGMVHGDLRPASVRLQRAPSPHVTVCGFATAALAAALPAEPGPYSTPERLARAPVDARTDVFALGLLVYELLEGKPLLPADAAEVRAMLQADGEPLLPRFSALAPTGVPALVARTIRRAPKDRYQSMAEVRAALDLCLQRLGQGHAGANERPAADPRPRRKVVMVVDDTANELPEPAMPAPRASKMPGRILIATDRPRRSTRPARILAICVAAVGLGVLVASWLPQSESGRPAPARAALPPPRAPDVDPQPAPAPPVALLPPSEPAAVEPVDVAPAAGAPVAAEPVVVEPAGEPPPAAVEVEPLPSAPAPAAAAALPPAPRPAVRARVSRRGQSTEPRCATAPSPLGAGRRALGPSPIPPTL